MNHIFRLHYQSVPDARLPINVIYFKLNNIVFMERNKFLSLFILASNSFDKILYVLSMSLSQVLEKYSNNHQTPVPEWLDLSYIT